LTESIWHMTRLYVAFPATGYLLDEVGRARSRDVADITSGARETTPHANAL